MFDFLKSKPTQKAPPPLPPTPLGLRKVKDPRLEASWESDWQNKTHLERDREVKYLQIIQDEALRNNARSEQFTAFADAVGYGHGIKGQPVDFDAFGKLFAARFKGIPTGFFETTYVAGHERGLHRLEYTLAHGSSRGPQLPLSVEEALSQTPGIKL